MLKIAYSGQYVHPLPAGHRFPMEKYELIPAQLIHEGTCTAENFFEPSREVSEDIILQTHTPEYWEKLKNVSLDAKMIRKIGFPLSAQLVRRERLIAQGTIECCYWALQYGVALNVAGGTHHAYADKGEGFCLLNDVAVAANYLLTNRLARKIIVIDLDVHQGNGTAALFQHETRVFTFSMHGKDNYPLHKEKSDLDIALPTHTKDEVYLSVLESMLPRLIHQENPDFLFYIAGVDILGSDKLGKLAISKEGCRQRDELVLALAATQKIPIVVTMGGGYSPRLATIVDAHCHTFRLAKWFYEL